MSNLISSDDTADMTENLILKEGVFLVDGALRSALYDTNTGNVYSINAEAVHIIKNDIANTEFLNRLHNMGLVTHGQLSTHKSLMDRSDTCSPKLDFAWLELTTRCNERCIHCYGSFGYGSPAGNSLTHEQWRKVIKEVFSAGARRIQFIGGEPFMYRGKGKREDVLDLIRYARETGFGDIEVFTNGTLLTDEYVARMSELGVRVAVSLYSIVPEVHDTITKISGSQHLTMQGIRRLLAAHVPIRIGLIAMRQNQDTLEETIESLRKLLGYASRPDVVRPDVSAEQSGLLPRMKALKKWGLVTEPNFRISRSQFDRNRTMNPCLAGKVAITSDGTVLPCIFSRAVRLGNLRTSALGDILECEATLSVWRTTKDQIDVCKDCEYRYACGDCRPLSAACDQWSNFGSAPPVRCTYNPYTGEWGRGVWRSVTGRPVYLNID